jgi:RAD51-like protein 2
MKRRKLTPLTNLPLRPSTLQLLRSKGFATVEELHDAKAAGTAQLAADLGVSSVEAIYVYREVVASSSSISSTPSLASASASSVGQTSFLPSCASMLHPPMAAKTASQLLEEDATFRRENMRSGTQHVITFCRPLDQLIGGGIALGELTEVSGAPGAGKTQLAMQLAVTARLPVCLGGVQGETVYVDAEGTFSPERCWSMAAALVSHVLAVQRRRRQSADVPAWFTPETILRGIHVVRVHDEAALAATIYSLEERLQKRGDDARGTVRLVVIDSIAFHVRAATLMDLQARSGGVGSGATPYNAHRPHQRQRALLASLSAHLSSVASLHHAAVVAVNQMTTVRVAAAPAAAVGGPDGGSGSVPQRAPPPGPEFAQVPALGEAWAHGVATRLVLHHRPSGRYGSAGPAPAPVPRTCQLVKSPRFPPGRAEFVVQETGIREAGRGGQQQQQQQEHKRPKYGE